MIDASETNREKIVVEALRHTEMHLKGLEDLANSSDRRALAFFAGGIAFAGFLLSLIDNLEYDSFTFLAAVVSLAASGVSISLILPKRFHILGHRWIDWKGHLDENDDFLSVIQSQARENDQRIYFNFDVLERAAKRTRLVAGLIMLSASIALTGQFISYLTEQPQSNIDHLVDSQSVPNTN